jgi:hypothetical protein
MPRRRQTGETTAAGETPLLGAGPFHPEQPGQEGAVAELLGAGGLALGSLAPRRWRSSAGG